jgi:hypothetical protein
LWLKNRSNELIAASSASLKYATVAELRQPSKGIIYRPRKIFGLRIDLHGIDGKSGAKVVHRAGFLNRSVSLAKGHSANPRV